MFEAFDPSMKAPVVPLLLLLRSCALSLAAPTPACLKHVHGGAHAHSDPALVYTVCHKDYVQVQGSSVAHSLEYSYVGVESNDGVHAVEEVHIYALKDSHQSFRSTKLFVHRQCCAAVTSATPQIIQALPFSASRAFTRLDVCDPALCRTQQEKDTRDEALEDEMSADVCGGEDAEDEPEMSRMSRLAMELRDETEEMFYHAYNSYMKHAFPWDELKPLSCAPRKWNRRERGDLDDVLGGFSLTLIDSLDTLAVMGNVEEFFESIKLIKEHVHFRRDAVVSVFETTIRVLGGLLSAHLIASGPFSNLGYAYDDELLRLALQLGHRLLPAFETPTDLPYHRVDLNTGVRPGEVTRTCSAAAGTLLMEFSALSRLTNQTVFEKTARAAVEALWKRRSRVTGLLGNTIDVSTGRWLSSNAGTGAGIDSFFEYLLKTHLLLDDPEYKMMFDESMESIEQHLAFGAWQLESNMHVGSRKPNNFHVSSLQAFWPGLLVLNGDIEGAKEAHTGFYKIWRRFGALPEVFDLASRKSVSHSYPLRPEFAESTMMLYAATGDEHYIKVGKRILHSIQEKMRVSCGFATLADVRTGRLEDRMDSYFLAETLKYLYMLFDLATPEDKRAENSWTAFVNLSEAVFTTEGHLLYKFDSPTQSSGTERRRANSEKPETVATTEDARPAVAGLAFLQEMVLASLEKRTVPSPADKGAVPKPHAFVVAPATFGKPLASTAQQHLLVYAQPQHACSDILNVNEIQQAIYAANRMRNPTGIAVKVAVLVDRGECSFVSKALNVEQTGAHVMFVINGETSGDSVYTMTQRANSDTEESARLNRISSAMVPNVLKLLLQQTPKVFLGEVSWNNSHHYVIEAPVRQAYANPARRTATKGRENGQIGSLLQMFNQLLVDTGLA